MQVFNNIKNIPNKVLIKYCGFTREQDIEYAVDLGVDAIGLVFYRHSQRFVDIKLAQKLTALIPTHIQIVGLFVNEIAENIKQVCNNVRIDLLQLHGDKNIETSQYCTHIKKITNIDYIKAFAIDETSLKMPENYLDNLAHKYTDALGFLLDKKTPLYGGSGSSFVWNSIPKKIWQYRNPKQPYVLSGGINAHNIQQALLLKPYAIDLSSAIEFKLNIEDEKQQNSKGIKSRDKMLELMNLFRHNQIKA
jgi:phosphoribosylanthranilate isomerase